MFSAMRISRLCLALLPAGCSQTLLCCGWVAVLPGAVPASSDRGCKSLAGAQLDVQTLLSPKQDKTKVLFSGVLPALGRHWPWFSQSLGLFLFLFLSPHDNVFCFCNIICLLWWFFLFITILKRSGHSYKSSFFCRYRIYLDCLIEVSILDLKPLYKSH